MNRCEQQLAEYATSVNDALRELLRAREDCPQIAVVDAMRYSLLDAGKRLRAALVLEFGHLAGAPREGAMACACAVEMVHAYSLIHDDLPCMDNDDFRRGKPSCHKAFGEDIALLAGDALLTQAFEVLAEAPLAAEARVQAMAALSQSAGVYGMVGGQVLDLAAEEEAVGLPQLQRLCALKTGALLRASARLGCIAGGAAPALTAVADNYAAAYGLAFQITDDILDVTGDAARLGKPVGSDQENHKSTYVTLLGLDGARQEAKRQVDQAKGCLEGIADNGFLLWLADMVLTRDH